MGTLEDFSNLERNLERELDRIGEFPDADRPHVKRFVQKLDGSVAASTLTTYLRNVRMTATRLDAPVCELTEAQLDEHVYDLRHSDEYGQGGGGMADSSARAVQHAVRRYLDVIDVDAEWTADYTLISPGENKVTPDDVLAPADIQALREGANNMRDIALIEFFADTGARLTLAGSLRVRDVDVFDTETPTYTPNANATGLKGADVRPYPIIDAKAPLRNYLRDTHPRPDDPDVALFHTIPGHGSGGFDGDGSISKTSIHDALQRAADNGGVDKPVNPHNFRHSAITRMVREGYKRPQIEHRVHWEVDTRMWETYQHISGQEHNDDIFVAAGLADGEDGPDKTRRPCPNCMDPVAPHLDCCGRCGVPISQRAREAKGKAVGSVTDEMKDPRDMDEQELRAVVVQKLDGNARPLSSHD